MISSAFDIRQHNRVLKTLVDHLDVIYRPWKEYLTLPSGQDRTGQIKTIIIDQETIIKSHKSVTTHSSEEDSKVMTENNIFSLSTVVNLKNGTIVD